MNTEITLGEVNIEETQRKEHKVGDILRLVYNGYEFSLFNENYTRGGLKVYEIEIKSVKETKVITDETC